MSRVNGIKLSKCTRSEILQGQMDFPMFSRKRPLFDRYEEQPPVYPKKYLISLNSQRDVHHTDRWNPALQHADTRWSFGPACIKEVWENGKKHDHLNLSLFQQTSSWADTQQSAKKVLDHLTLKQTTEDFFLSDSVNRKFGQFQRDITDECGSEDKQHSWAVLEKREEIIMFGPFYPNYNRGVHSEDIIVKQTQELLESEGVPEDWMVYVFTMNSPCLARNTDACMLKLVHKALEWWRMYGVKTHIGFLRSWGFKGNKEGVFKEVTYRQVECINQSVDYESYVNGVKEISTDLDPLCEGVFLVAKHLLKSGRVNKFPLITTVQKQDRRSYYRSMHALSEGRSEEEKNILTQEVRNVVEAAEVLLSGDNGSFEEYVERGRTFISDYTFGSGMREETQDQMKVTFQQCWAEMVQEMYAEFIREKLIEDFNHSTVQLFIKDIRRFTVEYLQIGKLKLSEDDSIQVG